jgi:FixJ family two-component response regulator
MNTRPLVSVITRPLVSVVDDDESVRESLPHLLKRFGFAVQAFSSAEEYLASDLVSKSKCLVVDINMPGMSGPDLLEELRRLGWETPVIFITAQRDETIRSQVLEQGAIACLFKPFSGAALRAAIDAALGSG